VKKFNYRFLIIFISFSLVFTLSACGQKQLPTDHTLPVQSEKTLPRNSGQEDFEPKYPKTEYPEQKEQHIKPEQPPSNEPELTESPLDTPSPFYSAGESVVGYWADIKPVGDSDDIAGENRFCLDGFYFVNDGTGALFHNLEGAFPITSYDLSDGVLSYCFLNTGGDPVETSIRIVDVTDSEIIFEYNDGKEHSYTRMLEIRPDNGAGGYTATQTDGEIIDVRGF
jgi:hypothetical protein